MAMIARVWQYSRQIRAIGRPLPSVAAQIGAPTVRKWFLRKARNYTVTEKRSWLVSVASSAEEEPCSKQGQRFALHSLPQREPQT